MQSISQFVKRNFLITFVVLSYLLSWLMMLAPEGGLIPHGPILAALIVVGIGEGRAGLKAWWSRVVRFSTSWRWYLIGAAIPAALALGAAWMNVQMGAQLPPQIDWTLPLKVLPIMLLLSGMWEEPGWTGLALPRLYERFGPSVTGTLIAVLVMSVIRTGWHLPLVFSGSIHWTDLIFMVGYQIGIAWLYNSSGSVLAVMLLHLSSNVIGGELVGSWFTGADWAREGWLRGSLWIIFAVVLLLTTRLQLGRKPAVPTEQVSAGPSVAVP